VSDHGEVFGENGVWGHNYGISPELVHVPQAIYRGETEQTVIADTVSLVEIYRRILDFAGLEHVDSNARGSNLLEVTESGNYLVERHGLRTERINKLQNKGYDSDIIEQYEEKLCGGVLASSFYGWESRDGFNTRGDVGTAADVKACIDKLSDKLTTVEVSPSDDEELPEDVTDRLEKLGYM